jgi:hypothetical protein
VKKNRTLEVRLTPKERKRLVEELHRRFLLSQVVRLDLAKDIVKTFGANAIVCQIVSGPAVLPQRGGETIDRPPPS